MKNSPRGFTLIELIIVVVIISILLVITIPSFIAIQNHAKDSLTKENMHHLQTAVDSWPANNVDSYPLVGAQLTFLLPKGKPLVNPYTRGPEPSGSHTPGSINYLPQRVDDGRVTGYKIIGWKHDGTPVDTLSGHL